jgi:hypothetical protein
MDHPRPRTGRVQRRQQVRARLEPQRLLRDLPGHHDRRDRAALAPTTRTPGPGELPQRPLHQLPQRSRAGKRPRHQPALTDPAAEHVLPRPELPVDQRRHRQAHISGLGIQHEYQPVQGRLGRGAELQLGIGHLRLVPHRRAVPGAQHPHIHITPPHPVHAQPGRRLISGREIGHVHDHVTGRGDRPLRSGHIRVPRRVIPQLRGMRHEDPPPAPVAGAIRASQAHPLHPQATPPARHPSGIGRAAPSSMSNARQ